jgi:hypothetical protein
MRPKYPNFAYLEGIQNFYFSSNLDAVFVIELISLRAFGSVPTDVLYLEIQLIERGQKVQNSKI